MRIDSANAVLAFSGEAAQLANLKGAAQRDPEAALKSTAQQFESMFLKMLIGSMRDASMGEGLGESEQSEFYQDMYDQQLALHLAQSGGIGLADRLVQQLQRAAADAAGSGMPVDSVAMGATRASATVAEQREFVHGIEAAAESVARRLGVSSDAVIAQAALESGWGRHRPLDAYGRDSHNLFGIKAGGQWQGAVAEARTTEYRDARWSELPQTFRAYNSDAASVRDYGALLAGAPRYVEALQTGGDVAAFATALLRAGYASDPEYVHKLVATAASVRELRAMAGFSDAHHKPISGA